MGRARGGEARAVKGDGRWGAGGRIKSVKGTTVAQRAPRYTPPHCAQRPANVEGSAESRSCAMSVGRGGGGAWCLQRHPPLAPPPNVNRRCPFKGHRARRRARGRSNKDGGRTQSRGHNTRTGGKAGLLSRLDTTSTGKRGGEGGVEGGKGWAGRTGGGEMWAAPPLHAEPARELRYVDRARGEPRRMRARERAR